MTKEKAQLVLSRYRPCEHETVEELHSNDNTAHCLDCGAIFLRESHSRIRNNANKFDEALAYLMEGKNEETDNKLKAYAAERGVDSFSVDQLIESHRNLIQELNSTTRPEYRKALEDARKKAAKQELGSAWVRVSKLKRMSLAKIARMFGD